MTTAKNGVDIDLAEKTASNGGHDFGWFCNEKLSRCDHAEKNGRRLIEKPVNLIINQKKEQTGAAAYPTEEIADPLVSLD